MESIIDIAPSNVHGSNASLVERGIARDPVGPTTIMSLLALGLVSVACGASSTDSSQSADLGKTSAVSPAGTISYAPNSYVIGNAYDDFTDTMHGQAVFGSGSGNENGDWYQCGDLSGPGFDHCGWVSSSEVSGSGDSKSCGAGCPGGADLSLFTSTYTDGTITPPTGGPVASHMYYGWAGCNDLSGYGNVSPWAVPAKPANRLGVVPNRHDLQWRYVSKDGNWVLVHDGSPPSGFPNWYFVQSACVSLGSAALPPRPACGTLQPGDSLALGESLTSCGGGYTAAMQTDGNFVLYQGSTALWSTATNGTNAYMVYMQPDGNLVLYSGELQALWATNTPGHPGAYFAVQDDSNIVVYASDHKTPLWARFGM
jgi:hypothetical protein